MSFTRLNHPSIATRAPSMATLAVLESALSNLRITQHSSIPTVSHVSRRNASHQAQGRANGAKDGPGKRLGAKKTGGQYVIPGNILFKQRGTLWFPGDNCFMGRDHTIHAGAPGYVRYYRDPARHPTHKFIGIVFKKDQSLPQAPHAVRRRTLGMLAYQRPAMGSEEITSETTEDIASVAPIDQPENARDRKVIKSVRTGKVVEGLTLTLRPGYQYRQANWEIGRSAERKEAEAQKRGKTARVYPEFKTGDRYAAWRKSSVRIARNNERRAMGRGGKKK